MRADRLLALLLLLQARGRMTAAALAAELECSERTIYRDLDALSAAGVPVLADRGPGGGCSLRAGYRTRLTGLTDAEVRALFIARMPGPAPDPGQQRAGDAAWRKLAAALPAPHQHTLEQMRRRIHLDPHPWFGRDEPVPWLGLVQEAVWRDRRVRVTYRRDDGQTFPRVLEPYGLVAKGAVWYCIAVAADGARVYGVANVQRARRALQTYRISRITAAVLTDEPFTRPDDFDLPAWWQDWVAGFEARLPRYEVTLRVPVACIPTLARLHGDGIHAQVAAQDAAAPDARVTVTLTFDSPDAACGQILALGPGVEILAPADLAALVRDAAIRLAAYYADLDAAARA